MSDNTFGGISERALTLALKLLFAMLGSTVSTTAVYAQCGFPLLVDPSGVIQASAQAGALNQPGHIDLDDISRPVITDPAEPASLSLDTGFANGSTSSASVDITTGIFGYFGQTLPTSNQVFSLAIGGASLFDYVCFNFPDGVESMDIQILLRISGSLDCAAGSQSCIGGGSNWNSGLGFISANAGGTNLLVNKALIDLEFPNDVLTLNATVEEGVYYQVNAFTSGAVSEPQAGTNTVDLFDGFSLQFVLPDGLSFNSASGLLLTAPDSDSDGVVDAVDNCLLVSNSGQVDTDQDGYGNACDADFNNDCTVNFLDIAAFSAEFLGTNDLFDLSGDGVVNFLDLSILSGSFLQSPGPSSQSDAC